LTGSDASNRALEAAAENPRWVSYSSELRIPLDAFAAGLGDHTIVTTLCPGGKERMSRLMNVVASSRVDLRPLVTHRFKLEDIERAYDLFANQRDGVMKVAITP
jgi:alcohol dehydrogenase